MDTKNDNVKECSACKTKFIRQSDMIRHIKRFHPKNAEHLISVLENKTLSYKCDQCVKQFSSRKNLHFHQKSHNGNDSGVKIRKKCPLCEYVAAFKKDFYDHCRERHHILLDIEKMIFASMVDFLNWKLEIEGAMNSKFVKEYGSTAKMTNYICSQSEYSTTESDDEMVESSHDKKINGLCPAGFRVMHEGDGKCSIYFVKTHICYQNKSIFPNTSNEMKNLNNENSVEDENRLENCNVSPMKNKNEVYSHNEVNHTDSNHEKKSRSMKKKDFLLRKREMMKNVLNILDSISNNEELEVVQELINPIKPILGILQAKSKDM